MGTNWRELNLPQVLWARSRAEQTVCAKQQAVVTVSFGAPPKVEQENKILGFSDQLGFLQAGLVGRGLLIGVVFCL